MGNLSLNFNRSEMECKCYQCGLDTADSVLVEMLQHVRNSFGARVDIVSGYRCEDHNRKVGGARTSQHLYGRAADIVVEGYSPADVYAFLDKTYGKDVSLGLYESSGFVHVDSRTNGGARWTG